MIPASPGARLGRHHNRLYVQRLGYQMRTHTPSTCLLGLGVGCNVSGAVEAVFSQSRSLLLLLLLASLQVPAEGCVCRVLPLQPRLSQPTFQTGSSRLCSMFETSLGCMRP